MSVQLTEDYLRDDIYYCECCGFFYDLETSKLVHVGLEDIPADFALAVMADRQKSDRGRQMAQKPIRKSRGFGKQR